MSDVRRIRVGLCAMAKKVKSKPMNEILKGIIKATYIKLITFDENMILNDPIEKWPICEVFISFYSHNFPLNKAIEYAELRHPYLINDLKLQKILLNRKLVYDMLEKHDIPVPKYIYVDRTNSDAEVIELDDAIEWNNQVIQKPFVEKPVDAENHNIYIYFPSTAGGGQQQLFRKIGDRSSTYSSHSSVRSQGSFIYETFMPTDGTDVKIYTVGDDYAHAEARKSPALDGKVERDSEGKEVRYPVILTLREKMMAKKVSQAFKQQICGFDLLRANGMSYVCDVNGFSFVKSSPKYYEDCAHILQMLITHRIAPHLCTPRQPRLMPQNATGNLVPTTSGSIMELRCVIGVIRHGDRTPKQKLKMEVLDDRFFQLFHKYSNERSKEIKLKKPKQLQEVLDIVREILIIAEDDPGFHNNIADQKSKYMQIRNVLEMYGHFSGINRKIQMKKKPAVSCIQHGGGGGNSSSGECECRQTILLVVKWGGELTKAGRLQAEKLGKAFRRLYPSGNAGGANYDEDSDESSGLGLLRLHSTYRHDLKIYASDEGRVQMTAAAFAKGFLALEGQLPPILVQMVKSANTNGLLDNDNDCRQYQVMVKKKVFETLSQNRQFSAEDVAKVAPTGTASLISALRHIRNPVKMCDSLRRYLINLNLHLNEFTSDERAAIPLYHDESWELLLRRWRKLLKDFQAKDTAMDGSGGYDLSKISDIYDNIKYDIQHNPNILIEEEEAPFFVCAKALADVIVPQEYGVTVEEKLVIGQRICTPLLRKILCDARYTDVDECTRLHAGYSKGVASPERFVRTRLYFTSESHLHALINTIRYGDLADINCDEQWKRAMEYVNSVTELNYLTQLVIMIFEDPCHTSKNSKDKFHVEIHFSPGAFTGLMKPVAGTGYRPQHMERSTNQTESRAGSTAGSSSKAMSRSSSSNERPLVNNHEAPTIGAGEENDDAAGFLVRDLWSKLSRRRKKTKTLAKRENSASRLHKNIQQQEDSCDRTVTTNSPTIEQCPARRSVSSPPLPPGTHNHTPGPDHPMLPDANGEPHALLSHQTHSVEESMMLGGCSQTTHVPTVVTPSSSNEASSHRFTVTSVSQLKDSLGNGESPSDRVQQENAIACIYHKMNLSSEFFKTKNVETNRKFSLTKEDEEDNTELNYLTYPASDLSIMNYVTLAKQEIVERKVSYGSAYMISSSRPLISTDVIKGAKHYNTGSIPDINSHTSTADSKDPHEDRDKEELICIPSAPCVPEIHSLETLHNALNLHDLEKFLERLISQKFSTPCESPK